MVRHMTALLLESCTRKSCPIKLLCFSIIFIQVSEHQAKIPGPAGRIFTEIIKIDLQESLMNGFRSRGLLYSTGFYREPFEFAKYFTGICSGANDSANPKCLSYKLSLSGGV